MTDPVIYGVAAEFDSAERLLAAARAVREFGYTRFEAYSPYPIKELDEVVPGSDPVPLIVFTAGVTGTLTAWVLQFYIAVIDYPINVGGRPLNSWPSFVPIMFELTVLFASLGAFFGTLWLCGLPLPHHPMFSLPRFARASDDTFFLCIEARDPRFMPDHTADYLQRLDPVDVWEVEKD